MEQRIIKILFFFLLLFDVVYASEVSTISEQYIIYNMNDNKIIDEKNSNEKTYVASLTKIMTTIVAIENIKDYEEKVTITKEMLNGIAKDVTVVGFKVGEEVTYNDLLYGSILKSGADAVNALAISIGGNKTNFISMMNNKVSELGLKNTNFVNVIGLTNKNNYSSAYDMSQILIYALKNEKFKSVFETKSVVLTNGKKIKSTILGYNKKSGSNISYITGSKTGYTSASGYCLASTATINDINYLLITLNAHKSNSQHIKDSVNIYEYFSNNYGYKNIVSEDDKIVTLKAKISKEKTIDIVASINYKSYLKNDFNKNDLIYEYDGTNTVSYFTKKGTKLGTVKIKYNDEVLKEFDLLYNQELTFSFLQFIIYFIFYFLLFAICLIILVMVFKYRKRIKTIIIKVVKK